MISEIIFPKIWSPSFVDIIKQEQKKREDCRKNLTKKAELILKKRLTRIMKAHRFDLAVQRAAIVGENSVEVSLKKSYQHTSDLASPYIELRSKKYQITVSISHNQFIEALEFTLFEEENINGTVSLVKQDNSHESVISSVFIQWEDLQPKPITLDFIWDSELEISDVDASETFTDLFKRKGFLPRDGTRLVIKCGRQTIRTNQKVKPFFGRTVTIRPQNYRENEEFVL